MMKYRDYQLVLPLRLVSHGWRLALARCFDAYVFNPANMRASILRILLPSVPSVWVGQETRCATICFQAQAWRGGGGEHDGKHKCATYTTDVTR